MSRKINISELADVATCQRRVYLRAKYGERTNSVRESAKARGIELHARAEKQERPDDRTQDQRCFIATAVYGAEAWQTQVLRDFRDHHLVPNRLGRWLTSAYYWISPPLARQAASREWIAKSARVVLDRIVRRLTR